MFRIVIEELNSPEDPQSVKRYEQVVDALDMRAVFAAVNKRPRKSRAKQPATTEPSKP